MKDKVLAGYLKKISGLKKKIKSIYLFGSRARGDAKPYSDYDLLLVVQKRERALIDRLYDAVIDVLLDTGKVLSLKIFPTGEFKRLSSIPTPFMAKILKEGIKIG